MIFELLDAQLVFDGKRTPVAKIAALEEKVVVPVSLSAGRRVNLQGTIDRIDQQGEGYTLIDYKTGSFYDTYVRYRDASRLFFSRTFRPIVSVTNSLVLLPLAAKDWGFSDASASRALVHRGAW